ncbi:MAG: hypothetical protein E3K36_17250 [Candidatus Brocadia sp.]|nr:hypothetical protein [Candidatus Brocadia sp.]
MRYHVTPEFNSKLASIDPQGLVIISAIVNFIKNNDKDSLLGATAPFQVRLLGQNIYTIKSHNYRIYLSFGTDNNGDYLLFLDIAIETTKAMQYKSFFAIKNPRTNYTYDPNRNYLIDPRRNMMIDPNRNMMIDPRRNKFYGGPYVYTKDLEQIGFVVRANENVILIFDQSAHFVDFGVKAEHGNINIFSVNGSWNGFLVPTQQEVYLRFNTMNQWTGLTI